MPIRARATGSTPTVQSRCNDSLVVSGQPTSNPRGRPRVAGGPPDAAARYVGAAGIFSTSTISLDRLCERVFGDAGKTEPQCQLPRNFHQLFLPPRCCSSAIFVVIAWCRRCATFRDQPRCARTSNNPDCKARDGHRLCCRDQGLRPRLPSVCNRSPRPTQIRFNACAHRSCRPSRRAIQTSLSPRLMRSFHRRRTAVPPQPHRPRRY